MEITIIPLETPAPIARIHVLSMIIRTFKGRRDVEVHLFRPEPDAGDMAEMEAAGWDTLIEDTQHPDIECDMDTTRRVLLEAFTEEERDTLLAYLSERYEGKVSAITACPMVLPIPLGLKPLSSFPVGKTIGVIRFDALPNYPLPFAVHGLYDLAQHEPLVQDDEA
ncbi:MAG: hypothetical protein AB7E47_16730 [Desulfovibrionaceae bacterium]